MDDCDKQCTSLDYETHPRVIIHIDMDCYYAQVEMLKNPELQTVPLGIQQKNIVVTSNYIAREFGIKKCMSVIEAKKLCPNLALVNGEDLQEYRRMSNRVTAVLQKFTTHVERLGLDENFLDVTQIVTKRIQNSNNMSDVRGLIYSSTGKLEHCICGCHVRLKEGALLAQEIRTALQAELGLTCCAGISHNKLLAKLVGSKNKPNMQTILSPCSIGDLLLSLDSLKSIPGIGIRTAEILSGANITTVSDLQDCDMTTLQDVLGVESSKRLKALCFGKDDSPVAQSGKPHIIGLEDSCKVLNVKSQVEMKFNILLKRLMDIQNEDGRVPLAIKVTLRKKDDKNNFIRETKQCSIAPSLFVCSQKSVHLAPGGQEKILFSVMRLFNRLVDISKPFHITLVGLAFTKFQECKTGRSSIASYLMKNISVQSITSLENSPRESPPSPMELSGSGSEILTDNSDTEAEPSPKKAKLGYLIARRRCVDLGETSSPTKLNVSRLRLNSMDRDSLTDSGAESPTHDSPKELQISSWKKTSALRKSPITRPSANNISRYFITNK